MEGRGKERGEGREEGEEEEGGGEEGEEIGRRKEEEGGVGRKEGEEERRREKGEGRGGRRERRKNYLFLSCPPLLEFCLQVELILIVVSSCPGTGLSLGKKTSLHSLLLVMLLLSHLLEEGKEEKAQGGEDA